MAKTYVQRIAEVVARKHDLSLKDAEDFVSSMFTAIHEGLDEDKQVKVKGLGTFTVKAVKARESVNVNTGERVVISSHDKVSFTPDKTMAELVNKPFAQFETVVLNDGVDFADEAAPALQPSSPESLGNAELSESSELSEKPENSETSEVSENSDVSEDSENSDASENSESSEPSESPEQVDSPEQTETSEQPTSHGRIWALIILGILIIAAVAGYFWWNYRQEQKPLPSLPKEMTDGPRKTKAKTVAKKTPQQPADTLAAIIEAANKDPRVRAGAYDIVGVDSIVTLRGRQTMHSYCKHTLGDEMIVYFQAVNGKDSMHAGEQMKVPRVKFRSRSSK